MILKNIKHFLYLLLNRIQNLFPHGIILLYHRVDEVNDDPHLLSVSPNNFAYQMEYIANHYKSISLCEMVERIKNNKSLNKCIAITFDDGYVDNYVNALPILEKYNIHATVFVTSGTVNKNDSFYWDKNTQKKDRGRPMTKEELSKLSKAKRIEIGAHTISHPHLTSLNKEDWEKEIKGSKNEIEKIISMKVNTFSYPFGSTSDVDANIEKFVKQSGYSSACVNWSGRINNRTNVFLLPRIIIRNWNIQEFRKNLSKW